MVATDTCGNVPSRGSGYMGLRENIHFLTILFIFNIFCFIIIIIIVIIVFIIKLLFLLVYISHFYRYCYYLN